MRLVPSGGAGEASEVLSPVGRLVVRFPNSLFTRGAGNLTTSDPLLTSAKWVAYGTDVSVGNLDRHKYQGLCTGPGGIIFSLVDIFMAITYII